MQARFQHTPRPSSDQFRQSSGIVERNFFHNMPFVFLILLYLHWGCVLSSVALLSQAHWQCAIHRPIAVTVLCIHGARDLPTLVQIVQVGNAFAQRQAEIMSFQRALEQHQAISR